ncbi:hypothetical protein F2P81_015783 [Scophthalmus maximus]|uniref:Uncharacterized protein n=1 Tax=Scophthalmus maximus TaxID=52904 RepID=A0A6A4SG77_SCOMX|nr:hypothetical protein F2P81_015783 [Scophthalmus maximus]
MTTAAAAAAESHEDVSRITTDNSLIELCSNAALIPPPLSTAVTPRSSQGTSTGSVAVLALLIPSSLPIRSTIYLFFLSKDVCGFRNSG